MKKILIILSLVVHESFRGKNSFGGLVINKVVATVDIEGNVLTMRLAEWYTNCRRFLNLISFRETTWKGGFFVV